MKLTLEQAMKSLVGDSILDLTSALDRGGQRHVATALPPGITRYPLYRRLGGPQGAESLDLNGIRSPDRPVRCESLY